MKKRREEQLDLITKKGPHGGAREGAGRPKIKPETVVIRIPKRHKDEVLRFVKMLQENEQF